MLRRMYCRTSTIPFSVVRREAEDCRRTLPPLELLPINLRHAHPLFNLCEPARHLLFANRHAKMTHPMNRLRLPCGVFKRPDIHPSYGGNAYNDHW